MFVSASCQEGATWHALPGCRLRARIMGGHVSAPIEALGQRVNCDIDQSLSFCSPAATAARATGRSGALCVAVRAPTTQTVLYSDHASWRQARSPLGRVPKNGTVIADRIRLALHLKTELELSAAIARGTTGT